MLNKLLSKPPQRLSQLTSTAKRLSRAFGTGLLLLAGLGARAQALSGAYTINSALPTGGTNFATFSEVATRLSFSGVTGPVTIAVTGGPYTEQFSLGTIPGTSATNTIVINGGGTTLQFASTNTNQRAVVTLNGADYVTIDNLNINATGGTYGYGIQLTSNADNNRITNNTINADIATTSTSFAGIVMSGSATSVSATGDVGSNNLIQGNTVNGGYYSITMFGNSTTLSTGNQIRNNQVRDFYLYGIYFGYQDGAQIVGNEVARPLRTNSSTLYGIYATSTARNLAIEKNRIHDLFTGNPTSTASAYPIYLATSTTATATAPNDVVNNVLYNLTGSGLQYCIYNASAAYSRIYNNTISSDDQTTATTSVTYGIYSSGANSDVRNNVVSITRTSTGTKTGLYYTTNAPTSSNNDIYVPNGNVGYNTTTYATLAAWQAAGFDQNSVSADPIFANPSTGNLVPGNSQLNNAGTPLARVTEDITGATRGAVPDMGAYEFTPVAIDLAAAALVGPATTSACYGTAEPVSVQVRNGGATTLNFATNPATVTVVVTPPTGAAQTFTTTVNTGTLASAALQTITLPGTLNMAALGTYSFVVTATVTGDLNPSNDVLAPAATRTVVAPVAGAVTPAASDLCISGTSTLTLTGSANGTVQWQQSTNNTTFTDIAGATSATFTTPVLTTTTYFRARTGCNTNSVLSNVSTITVNNPQVATVTTPVSICAGATATLTATGSTGTTLRYFDAATGGTALGTGPSFTTAAITTSRQYYVEALIGQATSVGPADNTFAANGALNITYGLIFSVNSPTSLSGVYVFPGTAGTITVEYQNSSSTVLQTATVTLPASSVGVKTFVPLNFSLQAGTGFRLMLNSTGTTATLSRNTTGTNYPFTSSNGNVSITANTFAPTTATNTYYYYFYDWQIGGECVSATRTPIQVNVTTVPATLTATTPSTGGVLLTATPVAGATYQFFRNGASVGAASTTNTLLVQSAALNGNYTVVVTSGGCTSAPSAAVAVTLTGTRTASLNGVSLLVYPNPTPDGRLTLELTGPQAKASQLEVLNSLGQTVQRRTLSPGTATLSLAELAPGIYTLRVLTEQGTLTQRVVRE